MAFDIQIEEPFEAFIILPIELTELDSHECGHRSDALEPITRLNKAISRIIACLPTAEMALDHASTSSDLAMLMSVGMPNVYLAHPPARELECYGKRTTTRLV